MKLLYRCEYCTDVGTEEEIREHEDSCLWNYTKKSCYTCKYASKKLMTITCEAGVELESGKYMEGCSSWEWDDKNHATKSPWGDVFGAFHL